MSSTEDALDRLGRTKDRANPTCPFMMDSEVYKRNTGPQNAPWVKPSLSDDKELTGVLLQGGQKYSLKYKLRDHVADLFAGLREVDTDSSPKSNTQIAYRYDHAYKKEVAVITTGNRKQNNIDSKWAEQMVISKRLGLQVKK